MTSNSMFSHTPQRGQPSQVQPQSERAPMAPQKEAPPVRPEGGRLAFDAEVMQDQLELFVREDLGDSALLLGELLIALANAAATGAASTSGGRPLSRSFHGKSFRLFADLLVQKREYKRAIQYYKRSWKLQIGSSNASSSPEAVTHKLKIAQCWIALDGAHQAIEILNSVPVPLRTLTVNMMLGKLYLGEGLKNKAEESYRAAVRQNPYALEATLALADITASRECSSVAPGAFGGGSSDGQNSLANPAFWQREIENFYARLPTARLSTTAPVASGDAEWLQTLVSAHIHSIRGRYRPAMEAFDTLEKLFPNNLHCLLHKGKLEMDQEFYHQAHLNFHRARQIDDQNLTMMDVHADCLRKNGARIQLNNLVQCLFETSEDHAESWLAASFFCDMKAEHESALQFCERAIAIDRRYAPAHLFRGTLLLQQLRPDQALPAFMQSCKLRKTLEAYGGIIMSYCELSLKGPSKYKEALSAAKDVVKLYPQKAQSYALLGSVLALRPETYDQAKKAFHRSLSIEPRKLTAMFGLADLLVREGDMGQAIDRLEALSEQFPREEVFIKLADVYTLSRQFQEAFQLYTRALEVNPSSVEATHGLERLEKIMRGEDPDELNSTMEHTEGDEQDDSMDAGEYVTS